jgi:hypothetical protein
MRYVLVRALAAKGNARRRGLLLPYGKLAGLILIQ